MSTIQIKDGNNASKEYLVKGDGSNSNPYIGISGDFYHEVALGNVSGYESGSKFGRNPKVDIGTVPEDLWNGGGVYTGQPDSFTPETVDVFSSDSNDSSVGTGARTIRIIGLKTPTSTSYEYEDITLNGITAVTSINTWWRINTSYVLTGGSLGENQGEITVRSTTTTVNVFVKMAATYNRSTIGAYTVPFGKNMLIKRLRMSMVRANGSAGSATVTLRLRSQGGVYRADRVFELQDGGSTEYVVQLGELIPALTDLKVRIDSVSDNGTVVEGAIEYILIDE